MKSEIRIEDVAEYGNLVVAHANARRHKTHYKSVKKFEVNKTRLLKQLEQSLLNETYKTSKYRNRMVQDSRKLRMVSKLPYYPDRIAHWAIISKIEPDFMRIFSDRTHAAIPGRGIHSALLQTRDVLMHHPELRFCLKIDVKKYFPHVDHERLKGLLSVYFQDEKLFRLLNEIIDSFEPGIPIGNYTSQYFANFYLTPFDYFVKESGFIHIRYMDDVLVFGESSRQLHGFFDEMRVFLKNNFRLDIKENWQIFPIADRGIDFVGYRIYPNRVLLRKSTFKKLRRKMAKVTQRLKDGTFNDRDRSTISSYAGWIKHCTPSVREGLFEKYFVPAISLLPPGYEKFTDKLTGLIYK